MTDVQVGLTERPYEGLTGLTAAMSGKDYLEIQN